MTRWLLAISLLVSCDSGSASPAQPRPATPESSEPSASEQPSGLVGTWHATLEMDGGALPFALELSRELGTPSAVVLNGSERVQPSKVSMDGDALELAFDVYDSTIRARLDGGVLRGTWVHTMPKGPETIAFAATRGPAPRFSAPIPRPEHDVPATVAGNWSVVFTEPDGATFPAQGIFESVGGDGHVHGTFLTQTGDYRFLEGRYASGRLELSGFDGAHAFLLRADAAPDGTLGGDFWAMGGYHATWVATKMVEGEASPLADPTSVVASSPEADGRFAFAFPDVHGTVITHDDPRFADKVVLVDIFGTWCPNCNDQAPLLARWHREYGPRGLELVGLAFEMTGDEQRDRRFVSRYAERHGLEFPLLLAGISDKAQASAALPALSRVASYPTTILVGRDGRVRRIFSGFSGPATGEHHVSLVRTMEQEIERLLAEP